LPVSLSLLPKPRTLGAAGNPVNGYLWEKAVANCRSGSVVQIWNYPCPQGYVYRQHGNEERCLLDHEGLALVRIAGKEAGDTKRRKARKKKEASAGDGTVADD
jgi:hypothetical protein